MARACTVCAHADRPAIDRALVAGGVLAAIAAKYRVSPDAVERHSAAHLPRALVKAQAAQEALQRQQRAITDLRDGAAHAAVVAGWTPVVGEDCGE